MGARHYTKEGEVTEKNLGFRTAFGTVHEQGEPKVLPVTPFLRLRSDQEIAKGRGGWREN